MSKKNRRKMRKALATMLAALLLVVVSVGATIAYLTDKDEVKNTFTVGNVDIKLDEAKVDEDGQAIEDEARVQENSYKVYPGGTYDKDPMVTVLDESEEAYIRMKVTVSDIEKIKEAFPTDKYPTYYNGDLFLLQMVVTGWDSATWSYVGYTAGENKEGTYEFRYTEDGKDVTVSTLGLDENNKVDEDKYLALAPLFTNVVIPGTVNNEELAKLHKIEIKVVAEAIQADGFDTAADAWAKWE